MGKTSVLVVDDERDMTDLLSMLMEKSGHRALTAHCGQEAIDIINREDPDVMLLDVKMPGMSGMEVVRQTKRLKPGLPVIMITAYAEVKGAIEAMRAGVKDYIAKPFEHDEIQQIVNSALSDSHLNQEGVGIEESIEDPGKLKELMGRSKAIDRLVEKVKKVAASDFTVIISGETGSGKELVARAIHHISHRASGPFVAVDCGAIPENLLESEMFGYEKGAFTGAVKRQLGKFEAAKNGTLLLDEISNMTLGAQAKLLRALQDKVIYRVGGTDSFEVDTRVLVSCNQELAESAEGETFRKDLYYRLNEFTIRVPSLRERKDDIPFLTDRFLRKTNTELGKKVGGFSEEAMLALVNCNWKGNVRQLRATVRRAVLLADDIIRLKHLDIVQQEKNQQSNSIVLSTGERPWEQYSLKEIVQQNSMALERDVIARVLRFTGGNKAKAARLLQVDYKTMHTKVKNLGITIH